MLPLTVLLAGKELCRTTNKWGMYVVFPPFPEIPDGGVGSEKIVKDYMDDVMGDARWCKLRDLPADLEEDPYIQMVSRGECFLLFDTEQECRETFGMTRGDEDGGRIYAQIIDNNGNYVCENT